MMKISIQGVKGAFHEEAARLYFSDKITIAENLSFEKVIESIENEEADAGIMAIENTISGTIHSNLELIKNSNLTIVGEIYLRIAQNLAVNKGVKLSDLVKVESHYMAINQCRAFFHNHPKIELIDMEDTALSMKNVSENKLMTTGAIGSKLAAKYYGLDIIEGNIESDKKNYTRFLILKRTELQKVAVDKSSIQLILSNKKGGLANILNIIHKYDIDLSKIESLPIVGEPWHYQFYIDVLYKKFSHYEMMLKEIDAHLESLSVLGNYLNQNKKIIQ